MKLLGPPGYNSWKISGSTYEGDTCSDDAPSYCDPYGEEQGCDCSTESKCSWTTCFDSVAQVVEVMDILEENVCIDLDNVWASGCSNGGMFTYELAKDERTAFRLKGIIPVSQSFVFYFILDISTFPSHNSFKTSSCIIRWLVFHIMVTLLVPMST